MTDVDERRRFPSAALGRVWAMVRSRPFTAVVAVLLVIASVAGVALRASGLEAGRPTAPLAAAGWFRPFGVVAVTSSVLGFIVTLAAVLVIIGGSERLLGWRRTFVAFAVTAIVGTGLGAVLQLLDTDRVATGQRWSTFLLHVSSFDPWTAIAGTVVTASAFAGALWRRRIRVTALAVAAALLLYAGHASDLYAMLAVLVGLPLGAILRHAPLRRGWTRSSSREVRVLLSTVVVVSAVGPVIALVSGSRIGLLAPLAAVVGTGPVAAAPHCAVTTVTDTCVHGLASVHPHGVFALVLAVMPLVVLAVGALGLGRGSRFALWLVAGVDLVTGVSAALFYGVVPHVGGARADIDGRIASDHLAVSLSIAASVLVPLTTAVALVVRRADFPVRTTHRRVLVFGVVVVVTAVVLAAVVVAVAAASGRTVGDPLRLALTVLGPIAPVTLPAHVREHVPVLRTVIGLTGPLLWLVVALAAIRPTGAASANADLAGTRHARADARALLLAGGGDTFGWMTTWTGNEYWFAGPPATARAAVAFRRTGGVAVTVGGPFGHEDARIAALEGFARHCDDNGWTPVFYGIDAEQAAALQDLGWSTLPVAEDADLDPRTWTTAGKRKQDVRTAVNKARREDITALWSDWAGLPASVARQVEAISEEWVSGRELPEMGFTLGGVDEMRDPAVRTLAAVAADGTVLAVTSWLPSFRDGVVVGWTLDVMRRRGDAPNGVMEFLVASAAERMGADGAERLSLSAAPLASSVDRSPEDRGGVETVLDLVGGALEPVYGFRSLLRFKAKFGPDLHPLVMAFPDPVALPAIGVAIVRTYLPGLSLRQAVSIVRDAG
ncbi:bifunctional lysylphosphatidylglycerol flippase/synthetase MprF [Curtobacterium sp. RRHDQ10]|uniref:bifunctional lysylphosphatidylglycerol flippase/synthetase MprF n=1 Tax=Curtobacterium phyllosphaerae TaxID=3413379 RepID=UPI003BF0CB6C